MRHQQPCPTPYISRDLDPCSTLASRAPLAAPPQFLGFLAEEEAEEEGEAASVVSSSLGLLDEEGVEGRRGAGAIEISDTPPPSASTGTEHSTTLPA